MKKLLILSLFLLVSCQASQKDTAHEVSPSGSHLGGVQGGGTEADRIKEESGMGESGQ